MVIMREMKVSNHTLIFAFRYALDRHTTAPSIVCDDLMNNMDKLEDWEKKYIISEIEQQEKWVTNSNKYINESFIELKNYLKSYFLARELMKDIKNIKE